MLPSNFSSCFGIGVIVPVDCINKEGEEEEKGKGEEEEKEEEW
jgi:hypothetical protein